MIMIVNRRHTSEGYYIGRPSPLGNPYSHKDGTLAEFKVATRGEAIARYEIYIRDKYLNDHNIHNIILSLAEQYRRVGIITLACWCKPKACHGDVLAKLIKEIACAQ